MYVVQQPLGPTVCIMLVWPATTYRAMRCRPVGAQWDGRSRPD